MCPPDAPHGGRPGWQTLSVSLSLSLSLSPCSCTTQTVAGYEVEYVSLSTSNWVNNPQAQLYYCHNDLLSLSLPLQSFSTPWFLFAKPTNHYLVFYLLEIFNNVIQYQFDGEGRSATPARSESMVSSTMSDLLYAVTRSVMHLNLALCTCTLILAFFHVHV